MEQIEDVGHQTRGLYQGEIVNQLSCVGGAPALSSLLGQSSAEALNGGLADTFGLR